MENLWTSKRLLEARHGNKYTPVILALGRLDDYHKSKASLVYITMSRTSKETLPQKERASGEGKANQEGRRMLNKLLNCNV